MIAISLAIGTPCFILFGWLSDKIGRKPIMMAGFAIAAITYFPIFQGLTHFANPKLEAALAASPVVVTADPAECSFQFKATGTETFTTGCDRIKAALVGLSVNYDNVAAPKGTAASVKIGNDVLSGAAATPAAIAAAVKTHGYPASADPNDINNVMTVLLLTILVVYVTMVYGPIAAWLVELFPTRIRYTGLSLPYHIGNGWFGGFLPATAFAIVAATGNIYSGLWYPIIVANDELRRRADLPAGDQGSRHHPDVKIPGGPIGRPVQIAFAPRAPSVPGRFSSELVVGPIPRHEPRDAVGDRRRRPKTDVAHQIVDVGIGRRHVARLHRQHFALARFGPAPARAARPREAHRPAGCCRCCRCARAPRCGSGPADRPTMRDRPPPGGRSGGPRIPPRRPHR